MTGRILAGDPFARPADTSDPWADRVGWLQARAHRPWIAVRGADLSLALGLLRAVSRQAYQAEQHCDRLRREVAQLEAELTTKHSPTWQTEEAA